MLTIAAAGYTEGSLTQDALGALRECGNIVFHTEKCGAADMLRREGRAFSSLDDLYETCPDFESHTREAVRRVKEECARADTVYVVFDLRDETVRALMNEGVPVRLIPGPPPEGALYPYSSPVPAICLAASDVTEDVKLSPFCDTLVREIDSAMLAGTVKLALMDVYPEDTKIRYLSNGRGMRIGELADLDRQEAYDHTLSVLVPAVWDATELERFDAQALTRIVKRLTQPDGCPWDRVQTHETIRGALIEEAYETAEAIDEKDDFALQDELGDVLYNVMLHADIAQRHGSFDLNDVATSAAKKLIRRHPFVFGDGNADTAKDAEDAWNEVKKREKGSQASMVSSVARTLPAMTRAAKLIRRAGTAPGREECLRILTEKASSCRTDEEIGDMIMAAAQYAASLGADPEDALRRACDRFQEKYEREEQGETQR